MSTSKLSAEQIVLIAQLAKRLGPMVWWVVEAIFGDPKPDPTGVEREKLLAEAKAAHDRWVKGETA
jgi:hypothetical protein